MLINSSYTITYELLKNMIDIAKKIKSQTIVYSNSDNGIQVFGFGHELGLMKTIVDESNKLFSSTLPCDLAIESKFLSELDKVITPDTRIDIVTVADVDFITDSVYITRNIFPKYITCGDDVCVPIIDARNLISTYNRVISELSYSKQLASKYLNGDQEFINILGTKTDDGASSLRVGAHLLYIAPNMLNVLKDDEVSVSIMSATVGNFAVFAIYRKKKKCTINIIIRIKDIIKKS